MVREILEQHLILRTSWVFSLQENNFVHKILRLGRERTELAIVDDQRGCPTSARSIASVLIQIAEAYLDGLEMRWGTFHYCNRPATTWYEFAREIFRLTGGFENLKLKAISAADYPTPAKRPSNSVLDCTKIESAYGIQSIYWPGELAAQFSQNNFASRDR
jgi:dTDP-4-dehydrorhamnose reductase